MLIDLGALASGDPTPAPHVPALIHAHDDDVLQRPEQTAAALERVLACRTAPAHLVSDADVLALLRQQLPEADGSANRRLIERWTAILARFHKVADGQYDALWRALREDERLALYHLSRHGFLNAKSRATAGRLLRRGLLHRQPALRILHERFAGYVRRADRASVGGSLGSGTTSWTAIRGLALGLILVCLVVLFLTRPDVYTKIAGLLTAVTGVVAGIMHVLGFFQIQPPTNRPG